MNKERFFSEIRPLFGGVLSQSQVKEIEAILDYSEISPVKDERQVAYILATIFHETGVVSNGKLIRTMAAVEEIGKGKGRRYGKKVKLSGKSYQTPDEIYYGRGHVQNTWYENYEMLTREAKKQGKDWDFLNNPSLLLQREPSIWATFLCMEKGYYTGKKLGDYFNETKTDWVNARRIINGLDKAELIAGYAQEFYKAII